MTYRFYLEEGPNWRGAGVKPLHPVEGPDHLCDFITGEVSFGLERLVDEDSWDNFIYSVLENPVGKKETGVGNAYMLHSEDGDIIITCVFERPEKNSLRIKPWELLKAMSIWREYLWAVRRGRTEPLDVEIRDEGIESYPELYSG